jgi:hypothetical protein
MPAIDPVEDFARLDTMVVEVMSENTKTRDLSGKDSWVAVVQFLL